MLTSSPGIPELDAALAQHNGSTLCKAGAASGSATSGPTEDCVEAERIVLSMSNDRGYFRLRHVQVEKLLDDGTLGLLLHGTSIVGFRSTRAETLGWCVGDQIVEINKRRASNFEEFMEGFTEAQDVDGFPIEFGVLRREYFHKSKPAAEGVLEDFFNATDLASLSTELRNKFPSQKPRYQRLDGGDDDMDTSSANCSDGRQVVENPYIHALKRRRDAFAHTNAGWGKWDNDHEAVDASVASRLAQRNDGVSMLHIGQDESATEGSGCPQPGDRKVCSWTLCSSEEGRTIDYNNELAPTPRIDAHDTIKPPQRRRSRPPPWLTPVSDTSSLPVASAAAKSAEAIIAARAEAVESESKAAPKPRKPSASQELIYSVAQDILKEDLDAEQNEWMPDEGVQFVSIDTPDAMRSREITLVSSEVTCEVTDSSLSSIAFPPSSRLFKSDLPAISG
jgi:hypothetical protein